MSKIAVLNDTHFGVRNASDIFIDYHRKFFRDFFFPYMKSNSITHILHLGDLYDSRKHRLRWTSSPGTMICTTEILRI